MGSRRKFRFRRGALYTVAASTAIGALGWFNSPQAAVADTHPLAFVTYGINASNGQLSRVDLSTNDVEYVGPVRNTAGGTLHGIEASAHFPGFTNLYAFWNDPSDEQTKLVFINKQTAKATVMASDLGEEIITGAVGVHPEGSFDYELYAMQEADTLPFTIVAGQVIPQQPLATRISVLGAAITYGGAYDMPVTVKIKTGSTIHEPFGSYAAPAHDSVNDDQNPRNQVLSGVYDNTSPISVIAQSWQLRSNGNPSGANNNHWDPYLEVDSSQNSPNVIVLRSGDAVPSIPAFMDQASVEDFLIDHINPQTHTIDIGPNQAIFLFELGTTNVNSAAADFQDLVLLLTFSEAAEDLVTTTQSVNTLTGSVKINPTNSPRNRFRLTKTDGSMITRDDLYEGALIDSNGVFYTGPASEVVIKPKGNGYQNTLAINGVAYELDNNLTHSLNASSMNVTVRNDYVSNGKAMGHWWIDVNATATTVEAGDGTDDPASNSQIIHVDQRTGTASPMMILNRPYKAIASVDGQIFYGSIGEKIYRIDTGDQSEIEVGSYVGRDLVGLSFAGDVLCAFDTQTDELIQIDETSGAVIAIPLSIGGQNLDTIVFSPVVSETISIAVYD